MKFDTYEFLSKVFLFENISEQKLKNILLLLEPQVRKYARNEEIYSPGTSESDLCFVISGECSVERIKNDGLAIPLNSLKPFQSFGIMTILSPEGEFPTRVVAKKNTEILSISKSDTLGLINTYPEIAMNVINFLSGKIRFLNKKIATFSSPSVEEKLSNYILAEYKASGKSEISFNCKKSADAISAGRASLYRAINSLTERGIIKLENKKIYILDSNGLERNSK